MSAILHLFTIATGGMKMRISSPWIWVFYCSRSFIPSVFSTLSSITVHIVYLWG
jgi:hypothetical protein